MAVGRKVTLMGQVAPAAIVEPHAAVLTAYWPVVIKVGTGSAPEAMLVSVMVCDAELPMSRFPKASVVGEMV